jgi:hypothetical protein
MAWFYLRVLLALSSWVLFIWKVCIYVLLGVSLTACTLLCPWVVCLAVVAACGLGLCKTALLMLEYLLPHRGDKEERGREKWKAARCRRTRRKEQLKEQRKRKNVRSCTKSGRNGPIRHRGVRLGGGLYMSTENDASHPMVS